MGLPAGRYGVTRAMIDFINNGGGGGGGNYDIYEGEVEVSTSQATKVTLEVKPDIILVYGASGTNHMFFVYDSDWSTSLQLRQWKYLTYDESVQIWAVPYTGAEACGIKSVDDDGFTLLPYVADYGPSVSYLALKRKSS